MITVSNSFKKAIKDTNRRIFGYVDVKYQDNDYNTSVEQIPSVLSVVSNNGILSGSKTMQKYATLEHNYTLLDGSFMVWNENVVDDKGYISNATFENIADNTIVIENSSTTTPVKGITIYFKENLPFNFTINITDTNDNTITENVTNNDKMAYQYIFSDEIYVSQVEIIVSQVEFPQNRLRIAYIDFNVSDIYEGDELVKFDVIEELDLLLENLPINNCSINLNNYPSSSGGNKFDPINPKGIVEYLNDDVTLEPYIGVLTEENGIEYVPMGVFYLSDWSSDTDGNVTLNGKSVLNKLKRKQLITTTNYLRNAQYAPAIATMIQNSSNANVQFPEWSYPVNHSFLKDSNLFDYVEHIIPYLLYNDLPNYDVKEYRKFYTNRFNTIVLDDVNTESVESISRFELKNDVKYTTNSEIKDVNVSRITYANQTNARNTNILQQGYTITQPEEYVWFTVDKYMNTVNSFNYSVISGSGTATLVANNYFMICIKFVGTVGTTFSITVNAQIMDANQFQQSTVISKDILTGDTLNIDFSDYTLINPDAFKDVYFVLDKKYDVSVNTIGDPSLEIGDVISIQTRYQDKNDGYKDITITKQRFTFDAGLSCDLEGVGD